MTEETYSSEGPQCPHCGRQYTADEAFYFDDKNYTRETCDECNRPFTVSVDHHTSWRCEAVEAQEAPDDGCCLRCGCAPRNTSGLCATCVDEDAVRAGELPQSELDSE